MLEFALLSQWFYKTKGLCLSIEKAVITHNKVG